MYYFQENHKREANELVMKYHYSRREIPHACYVGSLHEDGGIFGDCGRIVAACLWAQVSARVWSCYPILELVRLVRVDDDAPPLTQLISKCVKSIRKKKMADLLISYADSTQGHHGGIYQASSWFYHEQRKARKDGIYVDGDFVPCRTLNSRFGTNSITKLRDMYPEQSFEEHLDSGKHLYWKPINNNGEVLAERLGFGRNEYPKPCPVRANDVVSSEDISDS